MTINPLLARIYEALCARYGEAGWWPAKTPYEVIAGAILTQNTAWGNVERAIAGFGGELSPGRVADASLAELADIIRPAGFFNQKASYLKAVTSWFGKYGFDVRAVQREPLEKLRSGLLSIKGVGQETADAILLYAFGFPTFVIDAYTMRLCGRVPLDAGASYSDAKGYFEGGLPRDVRLYNNFHALIVINGKEHCGKKPKCGGCPLHSLCGRLGV